MDLTTSPLLTDLYQFNMIQAYLEHGETKTAVFEFFVRKLPAQRGFLVAAGLEQALEFLENLRFSPEELQWLASTGRFGCCELSFHWQRPCDARGDRILRQRADSAGDGASA